MFPCLFGQAGPNTYLFSDFSLSLSNRVVNSMNKSFSALVPFTEHIAASCSKNVPLCFSPDTPDFSQISNKTLKSSKPFSDGELIDECLVADVGDTV